MRRKNLFGILRLKRITYSLPDDQTTRHRDTQQKLMYLPSSEFRFSGRLKIKGSEKTDMYLLNQTTKKRLWNVKVRVRLIRIESGAHETFPRI